MPIYTPELVGIRQSVADELLLLSPIQTPMLSLVGFGESVYNTKHEWLEDEMFATESTVVGAKLAVDTAIVVADVEAFRPNQVIRIGEELLLVTEVVAATKTLTVTRGYADTVAADVADGAQVQVMFVEGQEGADARAARYKQRKTVYNYTQIFDDSIKVSGSAAAVSLNGGIDALYEYERQKKQVELALQLENAVINGVEYNNGVKRMMRGMRSFIQTNVSNAGGLDLTIDMINDAAQDIYEAGGFATGGRYGIQVGAKQKRVISKFTDDKIVVQRDDKARGTVTNTIITDFGEFDVLLNNNMRPDELMITDSDRIKIRPLGDRGFFHEYLGKKGDYNEGMLVGEYTLEFHQEKAHARIYGLK